ncbi:hypothetical protein [Umezawaea sp. NPDC059074]|uniref:hypothetical protein n=1 Tax=Umezawaea sp. NPDC059074 TaxID=3346716 RepID=UPI0036A5856B
MSRPDQAVRTDGGSGDVGYPEGHYTNVSVTPITGSGTLRNGTGTCSATGTFSAGTFAANDLPQVGTLYNITATNNGTVYNFPGWRCAHSGPTSDFLA